MFMKLLIVIENEVVEVTNVNDYGVTYLECDNGCEYAIFRSRDEAGKAARDYWQDMRDNDKEEFKCLIGPERLLQWACDESDSFGISSFDEFLDIIETVPEEQFAIYDGYEIGLTKLKNMNKNLKNKLNYSDYEDIVLYRQN